MIYIKYLIFWAKEMMSSKLWAHGENWPQWFDLSLSLYDLSFDLMDSGVWQIFGADCTVILRYCKSKSGKKWRSYSTLNHQRILNLQFAQFFKGLKRGLFAPQTTHKYHIPYHANYTQYLVMSQTNSLKLISPFPS